MRARVEPEPDRSASRCARRRASSKCPRRDCARLARAGLLAPQRGPIGPLSFGFQDLLLLRTTKGLLESGVPMRRIRRIWASLRDQLAADVPLTSITIHADGEQVVASDGSSAWRPDSGQLLLDFEAANAPERARTDSQRDGCRREPPRSGPDPGRTQDRRAAFGEWAADPAAHGDGARRPSSSTTSRSSWRLVARRGASRRISACWTLDPYMADAHVNLGRLYHLVGELGRAEAHYRDAVRLAPDDPVPHFNLGVLLEEAGRREEAVARLPPGGRARPRFADAHCNLGLLLESIGPPAGSRCAT